LNWNIFTEIPRLDKPLNNRAKLDTGTGCNYNCYFCYYQGELDKFDDYETIITRALVLKELGIEEVDLSGGESSIHKDWFKILDFCNKKFSNISCLSNGSKFSNMEFLKKSKEKGLTEILFSLHGYDEKSPDTIVGVKAAWKSMLQSIENAVELQMKVRINCTVTRSNVHHLDEYTEVINKIKPLQLNFLPLNYWDSAKNLKKEDYGILTSGIKKSIDKLDPDIEINVRYVPFCFMDGYHKYVKGIAQHIYDLKDWNIPAYDYEPLDKVFEIAKKKRLYSYYKPKKCHKCIFFNECDGIEHKYKKIADNILEPYEGKI
jgi:MoaA/NifB/PqqE/SkfB family radical SAM enzyme